jgi:hypothetical protein
MGGAASIPIGNCSNVFLLNPTLSPASVAPNTSAEQTFSVTGVHLGDYIEVNNSGANQAGLIIANARVTSAGNIGISFGNLTAATITPTAATVYTVLVVRGENYADGGLPIGISA